jgi:IS30 family transposase
MAKPEIDFGTPDEELEYAANALKKAGVSMTQFEAVRETEVNGGVGAAGYSKEMLGLRRWMVQELLAAKMSNRQIANVLKLSKQTVNADRHFNRQLYTEEILKNQDVHRARLLKEQMDLKDLALDSFEKSKKKRVITIMEGGDDGGKEMIKIEESAGDASFLNVAKNSLVEQAKLLGLNEIKQEVQQDNSYRKFLKDLSTTIAKEKEANATEERRENSLPAAAEEISFDAEPEKEEWPETIPLQTINKDDY